MPPGVAHNFTFHIVIHTGDFEVVVRHGFVRRTRMSPDPDPDPNPNH